MSLANTAHSVVEPSSRTRRFAGSLVVLYAVITMVPLIWIVLTSFKSPDDAISYPPKLLFEPSLEGYCNLFTTRSRQTPEFIQTLGPAQGLCDSMTRDRNMVVAGPSNRHHSSDSNAHLARTGGSWAKSPTKVRPKGGAPDADRNELHSSSPLTSIPS